MTTSGKWVLGHNQKQRGSELQAGARAQLIPSSITRALSSFQGRVAARTLNMLFVGRLIGVLNYAGFRPYAMMEAVRLALAEQNDPHPLVVDPVAGFSPQFIWLAEQMPHVTFMEIDLPEVIEDKQHRLQGFELPANLQMIKADLSQVGLEETLGDDRASVILALGAYVSHQAYSDLLGYLRNFLTPQGKVIAAFPYAGGIENLKANSSIFRRFAGEAEGLIENNEQLHQIFDAGGYEIDSIHHLADMARDMHKPVPADIELIVIAHPRF